ncbi:hypothetical protein SCLCIDRAFT_22535 [Scleroderma citrinum Foug A]|uniref:Uncharacterized protein n=1 Tax=Scleroderma citrinum Foug A TaxID=1036808 RepID=A0A0C2ZVZ4_9AGAM|nr:hypothetical protein SCLCIDRAFT_22535 [Scleroderma citrinum Foug A]
MELCFAAFLISFFALVVELNGHPSWRSFRVQVSTEDADGQWSITLEREHIQREVEQEVGYGPHPLDHNGNRLLQLSRQEIRAIEDEAKNVLDALELQNGNLTLFQQWQFEERINQCYWHCQQIDPDRFECIQEYAIWVNNLAEPIHAPPPYRSNPVPLHNPLTGCFRRGGEITLMSTPQEQGTLQIIPRDGRTAEAILQSLPSSNHISGKFIGLTDASNRHYPI